MLLAGVCGCKKHFPMFLLDKKHLLRSLDNKKYYYIKRGIHSEEEESCSKWSFIEKEKRCNRPTRG